MKIQFTENNFTERTENEAYFVIRTGAKSVMYTLWFFDEGCDNYRDMYRFIQNLSEDLETAKSKAVEIINGLEMDGGEFDCVVQQDKQNSRADDHYFLTLKFGKYKGLNILHDDLMSKDVKYVLWLLRRAKETLQRVQDNPLRARNAYRSNDWDYLLTKMDNWLLENEAEIWSEYFRQNPQPESEWVGEEGERRDFWLSYRGETSFDTAWGTTDIIRMVDEDGNVFIYKGSNSHNWEPVFYCLSEEDLEKAEDDGEDIMNYYIRWSSDKHRKTRFRFRATIKEHGEFRGQKQTVLSRIKFMREYSIDGETFKAPNENFLPE